MHTLSGITPATSRFEYDASLRPVLAIAPGPDGVPVNVVNPSIKDYGRTTAMFYEDSCCGQFVAVRDALGHGRLAHKNSIGEPIYSSIVRNYVPGSGDSDDNIKIAENTSRYRPDGRMEFQTVWTTDNQITIGNTPPPIAGVLNYDDTPGPPISNGVTTRYLYDYDLTDGVGLDSTTGETFSRLVTGTASVSLASAITKLADGTGGTPVNFGADFTGRATAIVSPDEKTVRFAIFDGIGRTVMSGQLTGPGATDTDAHTDGDPLSWDEPNVLMDWSITQYDYVMDSGSDIVHVESIVYDSEGFTLKSRVDGVGWNVATFDQDNNETSIEFDALGNPKRVVQVGQIMSYNYDSLGRQENAIDESINNLTTEKRYEAGTGRLKADKDAKEVETVYTSYDDLDRPLVVTDRLGHPTTRAYNTESGADFVDTITDAEGNTTTYTFDKLGRRKYIDLEKNTDPGPSGLENQQRIAFVYDAAGRQTEIQYFTDQNDSTPIARRIYVYEPFSGVLDKIEYRDASDTVISTDDFVYNEVLQLTFGKQYSGLAQGTPEHELEWKFTLGGQIFQELAKYDSQTYTVENHYDHRSRLSKTVYPSADFTEFTYTPRSEVDRIKWNENQIEDRGYTELGQLKTIVRNGVSGTETRYYTGHRLIKIDASNLGVGIIDYGYDDNNNKESEVFSNSTGSILDAYNFNTGTNGYDAEDRFVKFNRPNQTGETNVEFQRNPSGPSVGNIENITGGQYVGAREFNNTHQLGGLGLATPTQTFDGAGNLTLSDTGTSFGWNVAAGRMTSASVTTDPSGIKGTHEYGYDAIGRRAWKEVNDETNVATTGVVTTHTVYVYSGLNCISEYDSGDIATQPGNQYIYSGGIDSFAMLVTPNTSTVNSKKLTAVRNQQWSIVGLVDVDATTNQLQELYAYNVFGERTMINPSNGTVRTINTFNNPYGYTSQRHDNEIGLQYFKARHYNDKKGLFVSQDPRGISIGSDLYHDGFSLYRGYMVPQGVDPLGLNWWKAFGKLLYGTGEFVLKNGKRVKIRNWKFANKNVGFDDLRACTSVKEARILRLEKKYGKKFKIKFDKAAQPDFSGIAIHSFGNGALKLTGIQASDSRKAWSALEKTLGRNKVNKLKSEGYVWHHAGNSKIQLVDEDVHKAFSHTGEASLLRNAGMSGVVLAAFAPHMNEIAEGERNGIRCTDDEMYEALVFDIVENANPGPFDVGNSKNPNAFDRRMLRECEYRIRNGASAPNLGGTPKW